MTAISSTGTGGNWNATGTWSPAQVPTSADDVTIAQDTTVTINTAAVCNSLTLSTGAAGHVGGILKNATGANISLTVQNGIYGSGASGTTTDPTIDFDMSGDATHTFTIAGNNAGSAGSGTLTASGSQTFYFAGFLTLKGAQKTRWTTTTAAITGGTTSSIHVSDATGWKVGDDIIFSTTQAYPAYLGASPTISAGASNPTWAGGVLTIPTSTDYSSDLEVGDQLGLTSAGSWQTSLQGTYPVTGVTSAHITVSMPTNPGTITTGAGDYMHVMPRTEEVTIATLTFDSGSAGAATITWTNGNGSGGSAAHNHASGCIVGNCTSNLIIQPSASTINAYYGSTSYFGCAFDDNDPAAGGAVTDVAFSYLAHTSSFPYFGGAFVNYSLGHMGGFGAISRNVFYKCGGLADFYVSACATLPAAMANNIHIGVSAPGQPTAGSAVNLLNNTNGWTAVDTGRVIFSNFNSALQLTGPSPVFSGLKISGCHTPFSYDPVDEGCALHGPKAVGLTFNNCDFWANRYICAFSGTAWTANSCTFGTLFSGAYNYEIMRWDSEMEALFNSCPLDTTSNNLNGAGITNFVAGNLQLLNKNNNTAIQEIYQQQSATVPSVQRAYSTSPQQFTNSTSSLLMTSSRSPAINYTASILAENGVAVTLIGYMVVSRIGSTNYGTSTYPKWALSGLGVSQSDTYVDVSTGSTSLSCNGSGVYSGANFSAAGFAVGDRVLVEGFATSSNNGTKTVSAVSTTTLTVYEGSSTDASASARAITRWYKSTLTATQSSGADGNLTLTLTAQSANAGAQAFFSGVPLPPFMSRARHYGYLYAETVPVLTTNGTVSATFATALAYTGISVAWATSTSPVTISASCTFQQLYDYTQAWACQNVGDTLPLTGAGVAGSPSLFALANLTINTGQTLSGNGSINMGSYTLSTEFAGAHAYTYTGGTWSQLSTVPTFAGGTLDMPAEGTYTFTADGSIIVFAPSAASVTYDLGAGTFTGTLDLRVSASNQHPITVKLPLGTSYTTANNPYQGTTGTITVSTPTVTAGLDFTGLIAGSHVIVFTTGTQTAVYTDSNSGTTSNYNYTYSVNQTVDYTIQKAGYVPIRVTGVVIGAAVQTIPVQQVVDREYAASSGLTYGTTATVNSGTSRFGLTVASTVQNWYSFMIESWISQSALANVEFPLSTNGPNSYTLGLGWEWDLAGYPNSIKNLSFAGMRYVSAGAAVTAIWSGVYSVGTAAGQQAYYLQSDGGTPTAAQNTGQVDQLVQVYGDATHGNFDYRSFLVFKIQLDGYDQAEANVVSTYGNVADQLYVFALSATSNGLTTGNPSLANPPAIADHYSAPVTWNGKSYSIVITDSAAGNTGTMIDRWLRYNYSLGGTFQGKNAFDWPDLIHTDGSLFQSVRGYVYGDGTPTTLRGVLVVKSDGVTAHPSMAIMTADDGTQWIAPTTVSITVSGATAGSRVQLYDTANSVELYNNVPAAFPFTYTETYTVNRTIRLRVAYVEAQSLAGGTTSVNGVITLGSGQSYTIAANEFLDTPIGSVTSTAPTLSYLVSPVVDTVYAANLIDGTTVTDCSITTTSLEVDVNAGSTTWQHIYAFMVYWLTTATGIADQYLEMTATDQTHYLFSSSHGGQFQIKNVTSPSVPLLITGGNAQPASGGAATALLDTTGGSIFCIEGEVVPFNSSDQAVNLTTVQTGVANEIGAIADGWLDRSNAIETGLTPRQLLRLVGAVLGGTVSGGGTATNTFNNAVANSKSRVVATVDSQGDRSAITYDLT